MSITSNVILSLSLIIALISTAGCAVTKGPEIDNQLSFKTPEQAISTLEEATKTNNIDQIVKIFGPDAGNLINSGDPTADAEMIKSFSSRLAARSELVTMKVREQGQQIPSIAMLVVGKERWPFPIMLVQIEDRWFFDTENGKEEIIARRIGANELDVLAVCGGYVEAQREYYAANPNHSKTREYATRFFSSAGKRDGLYWESAPGEPLSPMGPMVAIATEEGYKLPQVNKQLPYHGYFFRILTSQGKNAPGGTKNYLVKGKMTGGFGLLAYPAKWDESGIVTFMVGPDGTVYQKDLGSKTADIVANIMQFDPDSSWQPVAGWSKP